MIASGSAIISGMIHILSAAGKVMKNHIFAITVAATGLIGSISWAECGRLCDSVWLKSASATDVQAEIEAGTEVNAQSKNRLTPLHQAPTLEIFKVRLGAGADMNVRNEYGATPLHGARTPKIVKALLNARANVNARDRGGATSLHTAYTPKNCAYDDRCRR